jgi:hypothetical protein
MDKQNKLIVSVLFDISNEKDGFISDDNLTKLLNDKYKLTVQQANFLKKDMESFSVVTHNISGAPNYWNYWWITELGWSVVRLEARNKIEVDQKLIKDLLNYFNPGSTSRPIGNP